MLIVLSWLTSLWARCPRRFPGLPSHWQQYFCCLLMHLGLPFLPLGLEKMFTHAVDEKSLLLFVAMYAMAIGITSTSILAFTITLVVGIVYCAGYGFATRGGPISQLDDVAQWVLLTIIVVHAIERFNRHVLDRAPFFDFIARESAPSPVLGATTQSAPLQE